MEKSRKQMKERRKRAKKVRGAKKNAGAGELVGGAGAGKGQVVSIPGAVDTGQGVRGFALARARGDLHGRAWKGGADCKHAQQLGGLWDAAPLATDSGRGRADACQGRVPGACKMQDNTIWTILQCRLRGGVLLRVTNSEKTLSVGKERWHGITCAALLLLAC